MIKLESISIFFVTLVTLFSIACTESRNVEAENRNRQALSFMIESELKENSSIMQKLENQVEFNFRKYDEEPLKFDFYEVVKLNIIALKCIDTTLDKQRSDRAAHLKRILGTENLYLKALDTLVKNNVASGIFNEDETIAVSEWYDKGGGYLHIVKPSFFFSQQLVTEHNQGLRNLYFIKAHNALLKEIHRAYDPYQGWFSGFPTFNVVITKTENGKLLNLQVRSYESVYFPKSLIEIGNDSAEVTFHSIDKDALILNIKRLPKGRYYPQISFKCVQYGGESYEDTLKFSFYNHQAL